MSIWPESAELGEHKAREPGVRRTRGSRARNSKSAELVSTELEGQARISKGAGLESTELEEPGTRERGARKTRSSRAQTEWSTGLESAEFDEFGD